MIGLIRASAMYKQKSRNYKIELSNEQGLWAQMTVLGCRDEQECVKYVLRTKDRDFEISKIIEIVK